MQQRKSQATGEKARNLTDFDRSPPFPPPIHPTLRYYHHQAASLLELGHSGLIPSGSFSLPLVLPAVSSRGKQSFGPRSRRRSNRFCINQRIAKQPVQPSEKKGKKGNYFYQQQPSSASYHFFLFFPTFSSHFFYSKKNPPFRS